MKYVGERRGAGVQGKERAERIESEERRGKEEKRREEKRREEKRREENNRRIFKPFGNREDGNETQFFLLVELFSPNMPFLE